MAVSQSDVASLYLAYFGRPPDPGGIAFYVNDPSSTIWTVAAAFSASPESQALYGTFGAAQINAIYQNLFNRDAEAAGVTYWVNQVNSGALTPAGAAYAILLGAQNEDKVTVANKLQVCNAFTAQIDTSAEIAGYSGNAAAARARGFVHLIDASSDSVTVGLADVAAEVAFTTGLATSSFAVAKSASNVVSFTNAGSLLSASLSNGSWTFTTAGGSTGSAVLIGTVAGIAVPSGTTLTIGSDAAGSLAFTGGKVVVLADSAGEDLTADLTATGVTSIELSSGHDYTLSKAQAAIAQIGASGTAGVLTDTGKVTVIDTLTALAGNATSLKASGVDTVIATVGASLDISSISVAGISGLELAAGLDAMTSAEAALITTSAGVQTVTLTDAASHLALSGEIETFKLANLVANSVTMGGVSQVVKGGTGDDTVTAISGVKSTSDLGAGTNLVVVTAGVDVSKGTFTATGGTVGYDIDAATTGKMTLAQVGAITTAAGTQNITLADVASGITLDKDIETFTLGDFVNSVTFGAKTQAIIGGSKADTVTAIDGLTSSSDLMAGANVVIVADGLDISGGAFAATGGTLAIVLDGDSTAKLSADEAANIGSATGTQNVTVATAATALKLASGVETFTLGNFTNTVTLGGAAQNVTGGTGADTVSTAALAASGTLNGGAGTADTLSVGGTLGAATISNFETLNVSADASIAAANAGAALGTTTLTMGGGDDLTMTIAQNQGLKSSATVSGNAQTVILSAAGTANMIAGIETYKVAAGASHLTTSTTGQTVDGSALAGGDVLTLSSGSSSIAATVTLGAGNLDATAYAGALTVTGTGSNTITTGSGIDTVTTGSGSNTVTLGGGADVLVLGSLGGVDTVTDFSAAADKFHLSSAIFSAFGAAGALAAAGFESGAGLTAAATNSGHIIYNTTTGDLYYDVDGSGGTAAVHIATLTGVPAITAANFLIVP